METRSKCYDTAGTSGFSCVLISSFMVFGFPDAPTPAMVIRLNKYLLFTLSPTNLHSMVDVFICMACI